MTAAIQPLAGRRCVVAGDESELRTAIAAGLADAGATVAQVPAAADRASADAAAESARGQLGGAPNALVATPPRLAAASIDELDPAAFGAALTAGYKSPFLHTQALLDDLRAASDGRVVYLTSAAGMLARAHTSHLAAAARAAIALMRTLAQEEGAALSANAIATGPLDGDDALLEARVRGLAAQRGLDGAAARAAVVEGTPLGRLAEPADVVATLRWLLGPESGFLSGQVIPVAGASELQVWP
jgi:NAD(P)-dependent dehydrogenase (short-subunit alcohol dehydrogenase family)